jgi:hypothetical protein
VQRAYGEGSFTRDPGRYVKIGFGYGRLSPWGPLYVRGEAGIGRGARILGTSNDERRRAVETEHLSPRGLHEGDLEGGLLYWVPRRIC